MVLSAERRVETLDRLPTQEDYKVLQFIHKEDPTKGNAYTEKQQQFFTYVIRRVDSGLPDNKGLIEQTASPEVTAKQRQEILRVSCPMINHRSAGVIAPLHGVIDLLNDITQATRPYRYDQIIPIIAKRTQGNQLIPPEIWSDRPIHSDFDTTIFLDDGIDKTGVLKAVASILSGGQDVTDDNLVDIMEKNHILMAVIFSKNKTFIEKLGQQAQLSNSDWGIAQRQLLEFVVQQDRDSWILGEGFDYGIPGESLYKSRVIQQLVSSLNSSDPNKPNQYRTLLSTLEDSTVRIGSTLIGGWRVVNKNKLRNHIISAFAREAINYLNIEKNTQMQRLVG